MFGKRLTSIFSKIKRGFFISHHLLIEKNVVPLPPE
ncbi:hypothetical protein SAMN05444369_1104 [Capnocytophaga haemolytica]|uniref:Uncharacterized protein n=1 Tax=Capnocytophaga haemolytica TaxID=45243 RepID=A0AAX2GXC3_9FLAO|nr:hypothetical protein SAMN05444369_1104 [Capnocytophaga haemolytica]SNV01467.1 Uncharacterised protein [Capnocytophaga haemolytica]